jgi:two-component system, chemotaxis family, response regulator Rcp1
MEKALHSRRFSINQLKDECIADMTLKNLKTPMRILMVDDNPDDVELFRRALEECRGKHILRMAKDGVEAMEMLRCEGRFADVSRPDLILLDLNMPRMDGREVLAEVKADEDLKSVPVIVLTSSEAPEDILTVYRLQANCYIQKPADLNQFISMAKAIEDFWFGIAKLRS